MSREIRCLCGGTTLVGDAPKSKDRLDFTGKPIVLRVPCSWCGEMLLDVDTSRCPVEEIVRSAQLVRHDPGHKE